MEVIEGVQDNYILWQEYRNSFKTVSTTPSRTCGGDSGRAVYVGNEIVGVHSAGPLNRECAGSRGVKCSIHLSFLLGLGLKKLRGCRPRSMNLVGRGLLDLPIR